jgi:hypothetical protein
LEEQIARQLAAAGVAAAYESVKVPYTKPVSTHKYSPDWVLPNGIVVESKGRFISDDRRKHLLIKAQHPGLDIRFVFSNSRAKISKASSTTYAMWCEKAGIPYADKLIPQKWLDEPANERSLEALSSL